MVGHDETLIGAHAIAVEAEHRLIHDLPRLRSATVHTDPQAVEGFEHHAAPATHR